MQVNYKRIAKNTIFLYSRMLIIIAVSFYTIRIVVDTLGVTDYGVYNLIASITIMLAFLNGMLASGTQRFLNFEMGKANLEKLKKTFSTSLLIHISLSIIILLLAETVGLWFLNNKANIPIERIDSAFWVYQISIITVMISIIQVPYYALIIAHEKMKIFAYISILEAILKLLIVYILLVISYDKLISYSILMLVVTLLIMLFYKNFCTKNYIESHFIFIYDKDIFKSMLIFSGWNIFGTLGSLISTQGINILLNLYFGPIANAAYAICMQFYNAIIQIINSFQNAVTPQITKLYATNQIEELNNLIYDNSKYAFLLLWIIALPLLLELDYILSIWLITIPEYTSIFTLLMIIYGLMYSLLRPLVMAIHATGKLKYVQLSAGVLLIMSLPISYILLENNYPAYSPFIVSLIIWIFHITIELVFLKKYINLSIKQFLIKTILPIIIISFISFNFIYYLFLNIEDNLIKLILITISSIIIIFILSFYIALNKDKRLKLINLISSKIKG